MAGAVRAGGPCRPAELPLRQPDRTRRAELARSCGVGRPAPTVSGRVSRLTWRRCAPRSSAPAGGAIARGKGRSYGDAAQLSGRARARYYTAAAARARRRAWGRHRARGCDDRRPAGLARSPRGGSFLSCRGPSTSPSAARSRATSMARTTASAGTFGSHVESISVADLERPSSLTLLARVARRRVRGDDRRDGSDRGDRLGADPAACRVRPAGRCRHRPGRLPRRGARGAREPGRRSPRGMARPAVPSSAGQRNRHAGRARRCRAHRCGRRPCGRGSTVPPAGGRKGCSRSACGRVLSTRCGSGRAPRHERGRLESIGSAHVPARLPRRLAAVIRAIAACSSTSS